MESSNNILRMLQLMDRPGFIACNGKILHVNADAVQYHFKPGMLLCDLLPDNMEQYENFTQGNMHLMLTMAGQEYRATVEKLDGFELFLLEREESVSQLRALALASQQLRVPLSGLMNALDNNNSKANRFVLQLHRLISNMSDAVRYRNYRKPDLRMQEMCQLFDSITESIIAHTKDLNISIHYTGLSSKLYCLADQELLERALLNMISNSIKAGSSTIDITVTRQPRTISLSVSDNGKGISSHKRGHVFDSFIRESGLYEFEYGLGLGMVIVQAAATAHQGTVLMEHKHPTGLHITLTLSIMQDDSTFHSPSLSFDYLGDMDRTLTELSDVLPDSKY